MPIVALERRARHLRRCSRPLNRFLWKVIALRSRLTTFWPRSAPPSARWLRLRQPHLEPNQRFVIDPWELVPIAYTRVQLSAVGMGAQRRYSDERGRRCHAQHALGGGFSVCGLELCRY